MFPSGGIGGGDGKPSAPPPFGSSPLRPTAAGGTQDVPMAMTSSESDSDLMALLSGIGPSPLSEQVQARLKQQSRRDSPSQPQQLAPNSTPGPTAALASAAVPIAPVQHQQKWTSRGAGTALPPEASAAAALKTSTTKGGAASSSGVSVESTPSLRNKVGQAPTSRASKPHANGGATKSTTAAKPPAAATATSAPASDWICHKCAQLNDGDRKRCKTPKCFAWRGGKREGYVHTTPKPKPNNLSKPKPSSKHATTTLWICAKCGTENNKKRCRQCLTWQGGYRKGVRVANHAPSNDEGAADVVPEAAPSPVVPVTAPPLLAATTTAPPVPAKGVAATSAVRRGRPRKDAEQKNVSSSAANAIVGGWRQTGMTTTTSRALLPQCQGSSSEPPNKPPKPTAVVPKTITVPEPFPPEKLYRALAAYSLLRTLSRELRLSPFSPETFLAALVLPLPSRLLGEVHVCVLRVLFAHEKKGSYKIRGDCGAHQFPSGEESGRSRPLGIDNLAYLDGSTWPLFYSEYVAETEERCRAVLDDEELMIDARSSAMSTENLPLLPPPPQQLPPMPRNAPLRIGFGGRGGLGMGPSGAAAGGQFGRYSTQSAAFPVAAPSAWYPQAESAAACPPRGNRSGRKSVAAAATASTGDGEETAATARGRRKATRASSRLRAPAAADDASDDSDSSSDTEYEEEDETDDSDEEYDEAAERKRKRGRGARRGRPRKSATANKRQKVGAAEQNLRQSPRKQRQQNVVGPSVPPTPTPIVIGMRSAAVGADVPPLGGRSPSTLGTKVLDIHMVPEPAAKPIENGSGPRPVAPAGAGVGKSACSVQGGAVAVKAQNPVPPSVAPTGPSPLMTVAPATLPQVKGSGQFHSKTNCTQRAGVGPPSNAIPPLAWTGPYWNGVAGANWRKNQWAVNNAKFAPPPDQQDRKGGGVQYQQNPAVSRGYHSAPRSSPFPLENQLNHPSLQVPEDTASIVQRFLVEGDLFTPQIDKQELGSANEKVDKSPGRASTEPKEPSAVRPSPGDHAVTTNQNSLEGKSKGDMVARSTLTTVGDPTRENSPLISPESTSHTPSNSPENRLKSEDSSGKVLESQSGQEQSDTISAQKLSISLNETASESGSGRPVVSTAASATKNLDGAHVTQANALNEGIDSSEGLEHNAAIQNKQNEQVACLKPQVSVSDNEISGAATSANALAEKGAETSCLVGIASQDDLVTKKPPEARLIGVMSATSPSELLSQTKAKAPEIIPSSTRQSPSRQIDAVVDENLETFDVFPESGASALPQEGPVKHLERGVPYHALSVEDKLTALEFLLDELLVVPVVSAELSRRRRIIDCFDTSYGALPTSLELEELTNVDDCTICGGEGDLLCCDGCTGSFHRRCVGISPGSRLPEGKWFCTECKLLDPSKMGPLSGGSKSSLDWFTLRELPENLPFFNRNEPAVMASGASGDYNSLTKQEGTDSTVRVKESELLTKTTQQIEENRRTSVGSSTGIASSIMTTSTAPGKAESPSDKSFKSTAVHATRNDSAGLKSFSWGRDESTAPHGVQKTAGSCNGYASTEDTEMIPAKADSSLEKGHAEGMSSVSTKSSAHEHGRIQHDLEDKRNTKEMQTDDENPTPTSKSITCAETQTSMGRQKEASNVNAGTEVNKALHVKETGQGCAQRNGSENAVAATPPADSNLCDKESLKRNSVREDYADIEFLVVHGFVFARNRFTKRPLLCSEPPSSSDAKSALSINDSPSGRMELQEHRPFVALNKSNEMKLLGSLGPEVCRKWPFRQVQFNPKNLWVGSSDDKLPQQQPSGTDKMIKDARNEESTVTLANTKREETTSPEFQASLKALSDAQDYDAKVRGVSESHDPMSYVNKYRKAPPTAILKGHQGAFSINLYSTSLDTGGFPVRSFGSQASPFSMNLSRSDINRPVTFPFTDPIQAIRDYMVRLEKSLLRGCLLNETWGTKNKDFDRDVWCRNVMRCQSINRLAKYLVILIDAVHSRAFFDEWNKPPSRAQADSAGAFLAPDDSRVYSSLGKNWSSEEEIQRRKWERCSDSDILGLLVVESGGLDAVFHRDKAQTNLSGKKKRKALQQNDPDESRAASRVTGKFVSGNMSQTQDIGSSVQSSFEKKEADKNNTTNVKANASPSFNGKKPTNDTKPTAVSTAEVSDDTILENNSQEHRKEGGKKRGRQHRSSEPGSRRRSDRFQTRHAVQDEIGSIVENTNVDLKSNSNAPEATGGGSLESKRMKASKLEKVLDAPFEKEMYWPVAGRKVFIPEGSLCPSEIRRIGRKAGSTVARFVAYSEKFEVGQTSVCHNWRTKMMEVTSYEDFLLNLSFLESHMNRTVQSSCETLARRSANVKANIARVVRCFHRDPKTGMLEYFVVHRGKSRGCWMAEDTIDLSALILELSSHVETQREKLSKRRAVKREKEMEERKQRLAEEHRRKELERQEAYAKRKAQIEAQKAEEMKRRAQQASHKRSANRVGGPGLLSQTQGRGNGGRGSGGRGRGLLSQTQGRGNGGRGNGGRGNGGRGRGLLSQTQGRGNGGRGRGKKRKSDETKTSRARSSTQQKYHNDFQKALLLHQDETKRLLALSAARGMSTVPTDSMNDLRIRHMEQMRIANAALLEHGGEHLNEAELTKRLSDAEQLAVQLYVKEKQEGESRNKSNDLSQVVPKGKKAASKPKKPRAKKKKAQATKHVNDQGGKSHEQGRSLSSNFSANHGPVQDLLASYQNATHSNNLSQNHGSQLTMGQIAAQPLGNQGRFNSSVATDSKWPQQQQQQQQSHQFGGNAGPCISDHSPTQPSQFHHLPSNASSYLSSSSQTDASAIMDQRPFGYSQTAVHMAPTTAQQAHVSEQQASISSENTPEYLNQILSGIAEHHRGPSEANFDITSTTPNFVQNQGLSFLNQSLVKSQHQDNVSPSEMQQQYVPGSLQPNLLSQPSLEPNVVNNLLATSLSGGQYPSFSQEQQGLLGYAQGSHQQTLMASQQLSIQPQQTNGQNTSTGQYGQLDQQLMFGTQRETHTPEQGASHQQYSNIGNIESFNQHHHNY